ncbi:MAG: hypothetical protein H0Z34_00460 [Brevibacillus sp.]|nr:hypothetical protein [Brevibacillus sp.]
MLTQFQSSRMGRSVGVFSPANGFGQPAGETAYPQGNRSGNSITSLRDIVLPLPLWSDPGLLLCW